MSEQNKSTCEHPEKLKGGQPGKCSAKQIEECHGRKKGDSLKPDNKKKTRSHLKNINVNE